MYCSRQQMRSATRGVHDEIDEIYWAGSGFSSHDVYLRFLQNMSCAYETLGVPACAALSNDVEFLPAQRFTAAIRADYDFSIASLCGDSPPDLTSSQAWGIGYALIGSCAGAKMMIRSGQLGSTWRTSYLVAASNFASTGGVARFFQRLDAATPDIAEATQAAHAVFDCLRAPLHGHSQQQYPHYFDHRTA